MSKVAIIMGSDSDYEVMQQAGKVLEDSILNMIFSLLLPIALLWMFSNMFPKRGVMDFRL